jgi:predicted O-methyltransferase YrrM
MPTLRDLIHESDPYEGFDAGAYEPDLQGWASTDPLFRLLFEKLRPKRVAEIGTWKGASALHMAQLAREFGIEGCEILCIDTWLGSVEHWYDRQRPDYFRSLRLRHGYPMLYFTFLANVVRAGAQDIVVPFPIASAGAARLLAAHQVAFDLIYIDAAHQYEEARLDVELFWPLVRPGGVLFGDDYSASFPGVRRAVEEFAAGRNVRLQTSERSNKWLIQR